MIDFVLHFSDMKLQKAIAADEREARWNVREAQKRARRRLTRPKPKKNPEAEPLLNHNNTHYTIMDGHQKTDV